LDKLIKVSDEGTYSEICLNQIILIRYSTWFHCPLSARKEQWIYA